MVVQSIFQQKPESLPGTTLVCIYKFTSGPRVDNAGS